MSISERADVGRPPTGEPKTRRPNVGRWVAGALGAAALIYTLSQVQLHNHIERLNNPTPPAVLPKLSWLGLDVGFWIPVFYAVNAVIMIWFGIFFYRHQKRAGTHHPALPVFLATWIVGQFWEPLGDWATYCAYHPEQPHLNEAWPFIDIVPTVIPLWILEGAYPVFFLPPAMAGYWVYQRLVRVRAHGGGSNTSWAARHPCWTLFGIALVIGLVADVLMESWMINIGVYKYTQVPPGFVLHWGRSHLHFAEIFFMGLLMAAKAVLLYRDDKGRNGCEQALMALPGIRRLGGGFLAQTTVAALATALVLVAYGAYFGAYRIADNTRVITGDWPYRTMKTYDPNDRMRAAGQSGPYQTVYPEQGWTFGTSDR